MFKQQLDDRISSWAHHRASLDNAAEPLTDVWNFWKNAPYIPYNRNVDPHYQQSWPNPWEIIEENHYDDFTKTLMIAWTLKLSNRFKNSDISIHIYVDNERHSAYNVVIVDNKWAINLNDDGPVEIAKIPTNLMLENIIEITQPR